MLIAGFTLLYVWKTRCLKVFQDRVHPLEESDHGYLVSDDQLPSWAIGRGLEPLQRCGHCLFALLAKMAEDTDGDSKRKRPKVELPAPTLAVYYSPPTLPSL